MSAQMQQYTNGDGANSQTQNVYVIFRVYHFVRDDAMDVKVLVDPETMRRRNELTFTAEKWSVMAVL
jgi:hypothetical protein